MSPDAKGRLRALGAEGKARGGGRRRPGKRGRLWGFLVLAAAVVVAGAVLATHMWTGGTVGDGDLAPPFTLEEAGGKEVSLSDFRGRPLVVVFFRTFLCAPCKKQIRDLQRAYPDIQRMRAEVVVISAESPEQNQAGKEEMGFKFPILSDSDHAVGEAYGVFNLLGDNLEAPAVFVLDGQGRIRWKYVGRDVADRPPVGRVLAELRKASS